MLRLKFVLLVLFIIILCAPHVSTGHRAVNHSLMAADSIKPGSLCTRNERVVWSCETLKERKLASVCGSKDLDETRGYVQYRFGRVGQVEMEFPRERANTQAAFKYSRYTRPLVTYLRLEFVNDGFAYAISDDDNSEEKPARRDASIKVTPPAGPGARETTLRCRLPIAGSLMKLEGVVKREDYMQ
jgi:hypothetical protein